MWKGETPEVRAKYHDKSLQIKAHLLAIYPNYRYAPRKSSEIRRRAPRRLPTVFRHNAHKKPEENNKVAGIVVTSEVTRQCPGAQQFLPPVETPGWTPYHLLPGANLLAQGTPAENAPVDDAAEMGMMNVDPEFQAEVDRLVDDWDLEAELTRIINEA